MKKKIITVLLTIVLIVPFFVVKPMAAVSSTTVTSYGQYYSESGYVEQAYVAEIPVFGGINIPMNKGSYISFSYQFKDTYDGFVNFTLVANSAFKWEECHFWVDGGVFTQQPNMSNSSATKTFQISFQSSTGFTLYIYRDYSFDSKYVFNGASLTVGSSNFNLQPNVADDLHYLRGQWDYYVPGMSTSLSNIASNTSTMASDIATLKTYLDGLEGYTDGLESYLDRILSRNGLLLNSVYYSWNTSNESLGAGNVSNTDDPNLYIYKTGLSNLTVKRVDARFSTNDVKDGNYMVLKWFFGLSGTGSAAQYYEFPNLRFQYRDINGNMNNIGVFTGDSLNFTKFIEYNTTRNTYIVSVYVPVSCFMASNNATFTYDFAIDLFELNNITTLGFMYGGMVNSLPYDTHYLNLLESINTGIGQLNGDYDTSTYDSYEQTMDGLNDNMRTRFNSSNTSFQHNIDSLFTPSGTAGSSGSIFELFHFNSVNTAFNGILSGIFTAFPFVRYLLLFGLILLVVGVFI